MLYIIPYTIYHVPCTMYHVPCAMCHVPCTIYHIPYTIYHIPYTIYHIPYTIYHIPYTIYHIPYTIYHIPYTIYHIPYTIYHIPYIIYHTCIHTHNCAGARTQTHAHSRTHKCGAIYISIVVTRISPLTFKHLYLLFYDEFVDHGQILQALRTSGRDRRWRLPVLWLLLLIRGLYSTLYHIHLHIDGLYDSLACNRKLICSNIV